MVLINDKKFACATCIKGHRVSGCTHTDRPLFEIKKKGRPSTQCQCCKDRRKGNAVHTKCTCGEAKAPSVIMPNEAGPSTLIDKFYTPEDEELLEIGVDIETRKGVPGSNPTFPNGLRDVHEMSAAADALSSIGDDTARASERSVKNLLNPCTCRTSGICKCCEPKRQRRPSHSRQSLSASSADGHASSGPRSRSGSRTPVDGIVPDSLAEMLKHSTTLSPTDRDPYSGVGSSSLHAPSFLSPDDMHHPRHTSPHVHKTKLYSPYSTNGHSTPRHMKRESSSNSGGRPSLTLKPPSKLRPLTDVGTLLGAALQPDGSLSTSIPRSAVGLPGISTFDAMAQNGGVKVEPLGMEDIDMPLAFPTAEDVVIGACTCGDDCECPGCATHSNGGDSTGHAHDGPCGEMCKSSSNCGASVCIPPGITSIQQLLSLASENVPAPSSARPFELNAFDTAVSPPSVQVSEDAAKLHGYVQLKPLECCNGRCQCAPGKCTCEKECCGCCIRCACAEDDGDARMAANEGGACCPPGPGAVGSVLTPPRPGSLGANTPPRLSPIPGTSGSAGLLTPLTPPDTIDPRLLSSAHASPLLAPVDALHIHPNGPPSPHASGTTTPTYPPPPTLRRSASTSQGHKKTSSSSNGARRATVTAHTNNASLSRSASTSKAHGKAAEKGPAAGGHHRPILPKPGHAPSASMGHLSIPKSAGGSGSGHPSRVPSPAPHARPDQPVIQITPTETERPLSPSTMSNILAANGGFDAAGGAGGGGNDQEWLAFLQHLNTTDPAYLQQFLSGNVPPDLSLPPGIEMPMSMPQPPPPAVPAPTSAGGSDNPIDYQMLYDMIGQALSSQSQPQPPPPALSMGSRSSHSGPPSRDPFNQMETYDQFIPPIPPPEAAANPNASGNANPGASPAALSPETLAAIFASYQWDSQMPSSQFVQSTAQGQGPGFFPQTATAQQQPAPPPPTGGNVANRGDPPAFPQGGFAPGFPQETVYSSFGKHQQTETPSIRHRPSQPSSAPPVAPPANPPEFNPNLIDLSKPLNPADVERIIKALQRQNSGGEGTTSIDAPAAAPPPPIPSVPQVQERLPQIMNALSQTQSQLGQSAQNFDLGNFLGYRPPDQTGVSKEDDLFSKYILDNPSEGLDLSALDLGTARGSLPPRSASAQDVYPQMWVLPNPFDPSSGVPPAGHRVEAQAQAGQNQGWSKYSTQLHGHGGTTTDVGEEGENRMWGWRDYTLPNSGNDQAS